MSFPVSIDAEKPVVRLTVKDDVQAIVDSCPEGTIFILEAGIYHNITIVPKSHQSFIGEDGAILSGAVAIGDWTGNDGIWSAKFPEPSYSHGEGRDGMAQYVEDLFVEGKPYVRVASMSEIEPGKAYYEDGRIYITDDPTGKHTVASETSAAFLGGTTTGVTIANITITNYASMAQHGAIEAHDTGGWTLVDVEATGNHGAGVAAGDNMKILGGNFSGNGQVGIHAYDTAGLVIDRVKVEGNNYAGFSQTWDAGGIKILTSTGVTVTNSIVNDNNGMGLWIDWDNKDVTITNNWIHDNDNIGLFYEASYDAIITGNNIGYNNKNGYTTGFWGSDLLVNSSSNVTISGNQITSDVGQGLGMQQSSREPGAYGEHYTSNNVIDRNTIIMVNPGANGFATDGQTGTYGNNQWTQNTYVAADGKSLTLQWEFKQGWAHEKNKLPIDKEGQFIFSSDPASAGTVGFLSEFENGYSSLSPQLADLTLKLKHGGLVTGDLFSDDATAGITYYLLERPLHGSVSLSSDGKFTYGQNSDVQVQDAFTVVGIDKYMHATIQTIAIDVAEPDFGSGMLTLRVSGDAWEGEPQFEVIADGRTLGVFTTSASFSGGEWQDIIVHGDFDATSLASVKVKFLNDGWGGEGKDRNLYVKSLAVGDHVYDANTADSSAGWTRSTDAPLVTNGVLTFDTTEKPTSVIVRVSGDSWGGDPQFNITINGKTIHGFTTNASHAEGDWQDVVITGNFGPIGPSSVRVDFVNDEWGGEGKDRNLYVQSVKVDEEIYGVNTAVSSEGWTRPTEVPLVINGSVTFDTSGIPSLIETRMVESFWSSDDKFDFTHQNVELSNFTSASTFPEELWVQSPLDDDAIIGGPHSAIKDLHLDLGQSYGGGHEEASFLPGSVGSDANHYFFQ